MVERAKGLARLAAVVSIAGLAVVVAVPASAVDLPQYSAYDSIVFDVPEPQASEGTEATQAPESADETDATSAPSPSASAEPEAAPEAEPAPEARAIEPEAADEELSTFAAAAQAPGPVTFVDLASSSEFQTEIAWMGAQAISTGYQTSRGHEYRPLRLVSRDAMAAFLYRFASDEDKVFDLPSSPTFRDVTPQSSEFYLEIEWAVSKGITNGYADGTYRPTRPVSRDAMAAFLYRFEGGTPPSGSAVYADSARSTEHRDAIEWLATKGISQGWVNWQGRVYKPFDPIKRDAMAAFLYRLEHGAPPVRAADPVLENQYDVWVTAGVLNLRSSPSWDASIVVTGQQNARARFLGAREGGWQRVRMGGVVAWAPTTYLTSRDPQAAPTRLGIRVGELYFRDGPSNSNAVVRRVQQGTRGTWTGISRNNWYWVEISGTRAWAPAVHFNTVKPYPVNAVMSRAYGEVGTRGGNLNNKYSAWYGTTNPYCMVFVMWTLHHAGYPQGAPHRGLFSDWRRTLENSGVLNYDVRASTLKRGDVAMVDWQRRNVPTHTGIVSRVEGNYVVLVEGNTTDGTGNPGRGVFERRRLIADISSTFSPDDYARSIGY